MSRRCEGLQNDVSRYMLLEQIYNVDAKEENGLRGINQNEAACTKCVYTKSVTPEGSWLTILIMGQGKQELKEMVKHVMPAIYINPFQITSENLINVKSGQNADHEVRHDLTNVENIWIKVLNPALNVDKKTITTVKLKTFHTQSLAKPSIKKGTSTKTDEVSALFRITQINARVRTVDVTQFIRNNEYSLSHSSLLDNDGRMRSTGSKATLIKSILDQTNNM